MDRIETEALVREYHAKPLPAFIPRDEIIRELPDPARFNLVEIITGMRRSGKTFYLFQKIAALCNQGISPERILYFNFADDRLLPLVPTVMDDVVSAYWRMFPDAETQGCYLFFDEVQEIDEWQSFCRRISENEKVTLVITGSSSKLSSEEIATQFRGRSHSHDMLPLSFREYCRFHDVAQELLDSKTFSPGEQNMFVGLYERYLIEGGFPGVQNRLEEDRIEILQSYVRDVVARDIAERFGREDIRLANYFALYGLRNSACELSVNSLVETLQAQGFKVYWEKAERVISRLEEAFLFFRLGEFSTALKKGSTAVPKTYAVDPGIAYAVSRANQQDLGKRFETALYLELRRRLSGRRAETLSSYTVPGDAMCKVDFILGDALDIQPYELIQVTVDMSSEKTRAREIGSLVNAMKATGLTKGTVITMDEAGQEETEAGIVEIVPAWQWCLDRFDR